MANWCAIHRAEDACHHWSRLWLIVWWHQAIAWINADLSYNGPQYTQKNNGIIWVRHCVFINTKICIFQSKFSRQYPLSPKLLGPRTPFFHFETCSAFLQDSVWVLEPGYPIFKIPSANTIKFIRYIWNQNLKKCSWLCGNFTIHTDGILPKPMESVYNQIRCHVWSWSDKLFPKKRLGTVQYHVMKGTLGWRVLVIPEACQCTPSNSVGKVQSKNLREIPLPFFPEWTQTFFHYSDSKHLDGLV